MSHAGRAHTPRTRAAGRGLGAGGGSAAILASPTAIFGLARNWASVGRSAQPGVGVVWRHHVGIITGRAGAQWIVKSGNDGNTVRERPRSVAGAIAFRGV